MQSPIKTTFFGTYQATIPMYDEVVFKTDQLYNQKPPDLWITWSIASFCTLVAFLQYVIRVRRFKRHVMGNKSSNSVMLRTLISCYIDTDSPMFVVTKYTAQSFWFLGGMEIDYKASFYVMMQIFALESSLDTLRVILAYFESDSLNKYVPTSDSFVKSQTSSGECCTVVKPTNVYEDLTRSYLVVGMVFVTQVLLMSFTVVDIYQSSTMTCPDGTTGCPVGQTLGSWCVYVIGVLMAVVYLLGPKSAYGTSELNPAFWLRLLLTAKNTGALVSWHDPVKDQNFQCTIKSSHWSLWLRFFMSFLVNGVGFHVLVHALPIQVAAQSTFLMVVYRSVGMMHLVDMDDTSGYELRLEDASRTKGIIEEAAPKKEEEDIADRAQKIVDDAKAQLDALIKGKTKTL